MNGSVTENGILAAEDFARYKARSVRTKFMQQLCLGIGGATVFGLAGAFGSSLIGSIGSLSLTAMSAAMIAPLAGLATIGLLGIGFIYFGSKFMSESIMIDQDFQAKKIGAAARGIAPMIEAEPAVTKPTMLPTGMGSAAQEVEAVAPAEISEKKWAEQVGSRAQAPIAALDKAQPWAERTATTDMAPVARQA